jgi:hypothetical protein
VLSSQYSDAVRNFLQGGIVRMLHEGWKLLVHSRRQVDEVEEDSMTITDFSQGMTIDGTCEACFQPW